MLNFQHVHLLHCGVNQSSGLISRMALNVPRFSVDARVFIHGSLLLGNSKFCFITFI